MNANRQRSHQDHKSIFNAFFKCLYEYENPFNFGDRIEYIGHLSAQDRVKN